MSTQSTIKKHATRSKTGKQVAAEIGQDSTSITNRVATDGEEFLSDLQDEEMRSESEVGDDAQDNRSESFDFQATSKVLDELDKANVEARIANIRAASMKTIKRMEVCKAEELATSERYIIKAADCASDDDQYEQIPSDMQKALEKIRTRKGQLQTSLDESNRILAEFGVRTKEDKLEPTTGNLLIPFDEANPKHAALKQAYKLTLIPIKDEVSKEIDFDRISLIPFKNHPELTIDLSKVPDEKVSITLARKIMTFLDAFEAHLISWVNRDIFDDVAWRYMPQSLLKTEFHNRFKNTIVEPKYGNRNWTQVKRCIREIFHLYTHQAELTAQLFAICHKAKEDAHLYAERIEILVKASGVPDDLPCLVDTLISSFPDVGRETAKKELDLRGGMSVSELLTLLRSTPSLLAGTHAPPYEWSRAHFGEQKRGDSPKGNESFTPKEGSNRSQPTNGGNHKGYKQRGERGQAKSKTQRGTPYEKQKAKTEKVNASDLCQHAMCQKFGRKHTDAQCYRHAEKARFDDLNKRAIERNKPGNVRLAALKQVRKLQEDSLIDERGINLEDMDFEFNKDSDSDNYMKEPKRKALDRRKTVPIVVQGYKLNALVDPGSTVSVLSTKVLKKLGCEMYDAEEAVVHYLNDTTADIHCTKNKILLSCNGNIVLSRVYILPLEDHDFLIGADLFSSFGMTINFGRIDDNGSRSLMNDRDGREE
ncbi:hypothetical protein BGZ49_003691 [Haplosporangium sp. Z 27]|nr:hypothetical protein BGZ49_003691 [Haplosporangium sp. Z 27]